MDIEDAGAEWTNVGMTVRGGRGGAGGVTIERVDPGHPHFAAFARVFLEAGEADWGRHHTAYSVDELRAFWRKDAAHRHGAVAVVDDAVVGAVMVTLPQRDNAHLAFVDLAVVPVLRRRGVGRALLGAAERLVADEGRTTIFVETQTPAGRDESADAGPSFARTVGYAPAQRVARNAQSLPASADVQQAMQTAVAVEDDYAIVTAVGALPQDWLSGRARLGAMMSTDTPLGDLDLQPETVDEVRVQDEYDHALAAGRTIVTALARHRPSGEFVAFTEVQVSQATPWVAYQDDTLVEEAHRGHGLGFRVKAAAAQVVTQVAPEVEVQRTWNDETNTHMLRTNAALGYVREGTMIEWQKVLR